MSKTIFILLSIVSLYGCGKDRRYQNIGSEFYKYAVRFDTLADSMESPVAINDLEIVFVSIKSTDGTFMAQCETGRTKKTDIFGLGITYDRLPNRIEVVKEWWESNGDYQVYGLINESWCYNDRSKCLAAYRESLIFHEMNHCTRSHREHEDSNLPGTYSSNSIMNSSFMPDYNYFTYYNHYIRNLYDRNDDYKPTLDLVFDKTIY